MFVFSGFLCRFILNLCHLIFSFYLHLYYLKCLLCRMLYNVRNVFFSKFKKHQLELVFIEKTVKHYSKIPKHLVFILGEECVSYDDLVQLIVWNLSAGISVLSFYDHKDELNANELYKRFIKKFEDLVHCIRWGVSFSRDISYSEAKMSSQSQMHVNVFDSRFSRQLLIDSVKELSDKTDLKLKDRNSTEAALDDLMFSKMDYCGNPDLLVTNGYVYKTYGLSPWHIGFTEFQIIPSYRLLTIENFVKILGGYSDCEQKFGR